MSFCRQDVVKAKQEEAAATSGLEHVSKALQEVRGRVEHRRADSQAQTSQGAVVKALMAAKTNKDIPGILGRLGNLLRTRQQDHIAHDHNPDQTPWTALFFLFS